MIEIIKCPRHPKYEAKGKPTGDCQICYTMWEQKKLANEKNENIRI